MPNNDEQERGTNPSCEPVRPKWSMKSNNFRFDVEKIFLAGFSSKAIMNLKLVSLVVVTEAPAACNGQDSDGDGVDDGSDSAPTDPCKSDEPEDEEPVPPAEDAEERASGGYSSVGAWGLTGPVSSGPRCEDCEKDEDSWMYNLPVRNDNANTDKDAELPDEEEEKPKCCGVEYDPEKQCCCDNKLIDKYEGSIHSSGGDPGHSFISLTNKNDSNSDTGHTTYGTRLNSHAHDFFVTENQKDGQGLSCGGLYKNYEKNEHSYGGSAKSNDKGGSHYTGTRRTNTTCGKPEEPGNPGYFPVGNNCSTFAANYWNDIFPNDKISLDTGVAIDLDGVDFSPLDTPENLEDLIKDKNNENGRDNDDAGCE